MIYAPEFIVDSFAGGGGAGLGIAQALGRSADMAINHDAAAIAMYQRNHPGTRTMTEDVWHVDPLAAVSGRNVGLLWASPDCKHFSRAKGGKPVEKHIRSLAWVVVKWADQVRPRIIILENVREFAEWGPIVPAWRCSACQWRGTEGQATLVRTRRRCPKCESKRLIETEDLIPDPARKGLTFKRWAGRLRGLGYKVEWRNLNAADFGAPTHRRRLFLIARRDRQPIVWPEPTHGDPKNLDATPLFSRLAPWRTAAECIDWSIECPSIFDRKKPLAEATMRRIAMGVKRYVLENPQPFIVGVGGRMGQSPASAVDQPNNTITAKNDRAIVVPVIARTGQINGNGKYCNSINDPLTTITSKAEHLLISPTLIQTGYGERPGQSPRVPGLGKPLGTTVGGGTKHALVAAFLAKHFGGVVGVPIDTPLPTTTMIPTQNQIIAANLVHMNHGEKQWSSVDEPLRTITSGKHAALVYSFLVRYFGTAIGQHVTEPLYTITGKDRFGLVTVSIDGELYVIVDIGMRMLTPRELARAQGFPDTYELTGTKTSQVARIGNSVPPVMAKVLVEANCEMEVASL